MGVHFIERLFFSVKYFRCHKTSFSMNGHFSARGLWPIISVGRRTVDFAYCRRPENRPPNDALSSGGFFDLVGFPTYVSLYIWRWSNEIDSTSGGGGSISNDALSIDPKSVSTTGILPWTGFPLLYQHIAYCLTTNSTVRQGGGVNIEWRTVVRRNFWLGRFSN